MRTDTVETKVFAFNELSAKAKQAATEALSEINIGHEWWEEAFEDTKTIGKLMGVNIDNIYFSGFASKGDGACFDGDYEYMKGSVAAVKDHASDVELHRIAAELAAVQRRCFYQVRASVKHCGQYSHRYCTNINVCFESHINGHNYYSHNDEADVIELLRDFMLWIYQQLEAEYNYCTSDEAIQETIKANEYEFTEAGALYN